MVFNRQTRIGMLWGDYPWTTAPKKMGKLWSMGRVARDVSHALRENMVVIPYAQSEGEPNQRENMTSFLKSVDILWADLYPSSTYALNLRDELGLTCPAILFAGGAMPKGAEAMLFPWQPLLRPYDGILFSCKADQDIWRQLTEWSKLKEWVIPLSIDEQIFYPRSVDEQMDIRNKFGIPIHSPLLIFVGRLNIQKNVHTLLKILSSVSEEIPDVHLCIIGEEDDIVLGEFNVRNTNYKAWLQQKTDELGLTQHVRFVGPLFGDELAQMYSAADVVTNFGFYHRENFGLSQAEAAACGTPVVCTEWGGFKDVVQHGLTGYFVDAVLTKRGIRVDWAKGVASVITLLQREDLRVEIGKQAANYAHQHFSIAALTKNLVNVVTEIQSSLATMSKGALNSVAYKPSRFAEQYEAHKRTCGWYATSTTTGTPQWYPPMFEGEQYELYEKLMQPYSTRLAEELQINSLSENCIPYFTSSVRFDITRLLAISEDPVWPSRRFLSPNEYSMLRFIDGNRTLSNISTMAGIELTPCIISIWNLYLDGFLLFRR